MCWPVIIDIIDILIAIELIVSVKITIAIEKILTLV